MEIRRALLTQGNEKLSPGVFHFDIPAGRTCPGKSRLCSRRCYARRSRYRFPQVQERLAWAYAQTKRSDFVERMVREIYRKGVILMRWHCAGDIYSPAYGRKVLEIIARSDHCTFWLYSRSWRVPAILPVLKAISALPNAHVWFSADAETRYPTEVPGRVRVAWMMTDAEEVVDADLVFVDRPLRRLTLATLPVCPQETPEGKTRGVTCATCRVCWRD